MGSPQRGATIVLHPDGIRIPTHLADLDEFRAWVQSDEFPEKGRIDWIGGEMEVDMSPEDLNTHGSAKTAIARDLSQFVEVARLGVVYVDSARISVPEADLSAEPDVVCILAASEEAGRVRLVPKAGGKRGRYVEIEGPPDIVVECVSDSSETKDADRLRDRYERAGVREYWLVDARQDPPSLTLLASGSAGFAVTPPDAEGFARSGVLHRAVRLVRLPPLGKFTLYRLEHRP